MAVCFLSIQLVKAQSTSLINCGIQYFYDAAGNRILRMAIPCEPPGNTGNNGTKSLSIGSDTTAGVKDSSVLATFQIVMINPNPTAGPFNITCNQVLNNAVVSITDLNGQVVSQSIANGTSIQMDISNLTPGVYTVVVTSNGTPTTKTLVKMSAH